MTSEERKAIEDRVADLKAKADRRRCEPGYRANVAHLDDEIAKLQQQLTEDQ
jgi:hypothetical protein